MPTKVDAAHAAGLIKPVEVVLVENLIQSHVEGDWRHYAAGRGLPPHIDACFACRFRLPIAIGDRVVRGSILSTARCKPQHRAQDFVAFLREIDASVEPVLEVHVVWDNLSAHRARVVHRWLLRHPRFHLHFTPTYASWLNLVERFFGLLTEKALRRGSHTSVPQLRAAILAYVAAHNDTGTPFTWTRTADEIFDKMRRFGLRTQQVHGQ